MDIKFEFMEPQLSLIGQLNKYWICKLGKYSEIYCLHDAIHIQVKLTRN